MGRLFKPVSNGRARLMIEIAFPAIQNPAYRFAADNIPLPLNRKGLFFTIKKCLFFYTNLIY
jgi:hypothetical protein